MYYQFKDGERWLTETSGSINSLLLMNTKRWKNFEKEDSGTVFQVSTFTRGSPWSRGNFSYTFVKRVA
jgi:hypothetical protein